MSRNSSYFQESASASSQHYCLRWNNYQTNMTSVFHQLLQNESFVDVTLACNDVSLKAHKVVLSACSSYFQKLLMENPCNHPTIIMPPDICFEDLKFIIEFVYRGEIDVSQEELQSLLRTADQLKIKGLCDVSGEKEADTYPFYDDSPTLLKKTTQSKICRLTPSKRPYARETGLNKRLYSSEQRNFSNKDFTGSSSSNRTEFISGDTDGGQQSHQNKTLKSEQTADCGESGGGEEDGVNMPVVTQQLQEAAVANQRADAWSPAPPDASDAHGTLIAAQTLFPGHVELPPEPPAPAATPVPCSPQELMQTGGHLDPCSPATHHDLSESNMSTGSCGALDGGDVKVKFETLRSIDSLDACSSHSGESSVADLSASASMHTTMMITPELLGLIPSETDMTEDPMGLNGMKSSSNGHNSHGGHHSVHVGNGGSSSHSGSGHNSGPKTWSQEDMELALDALRNHNMSLTKASATYGIPSTTLWQRAHRLGIDTPKKEGPTKSWTEENLNSALEALRTGTISANKASKAYGIPSSTLYKIARREGIRLAAPFNAAPTTWSPEDLEKALESIRSGQTSVQRASTEFGIPTGTLYGRCKREGIELSRSNPTPWSEDAMGEALEAVRVGHMSINQAAIHYNLPYSSLYGRFKRGKYETEPPNSSNDHSNDQSSTSNIPEQQMMYSSSSNQGQSSQQSAHNMASVHNMVATTSQYQHQNIS